MPWFPVDDQFAFHRKAIAAGNAAIGLWTRAGSWCKGTLTDGFVPAEIARSLGTTAQAKALVTSGLWDTVEGGYRFHEWDERNDSKADIEARRKTDRERKAARRRTGNGESPGGIQPDNRPESDRNPNGIRTESSLRARTYPTQPNPTQPIPSEMVAFGGESPESIASAKEPPPRTCPKHPNGTTEPCAACGDARKARDAFDRTDADRAIAVRKNRRGLIDACEWCDANGIRNEPHSLADFDLPAVRCDHSPMSVDSWRSLIPAEASHA